jgi:hypothetical protein
MATRLLARRANATLLSFAVLVSPRDLPMLAPDYLPPVASHSTRPTSLGDPAPHRDRPSRRFDSPALHTSRRRPLSALPPSTRHVFSPSSRSSHVLRLAGMGLTGPPRRLYSTAVMTTRVGLTRRARSGLTDVSTLAIAILLSRLSRSAIYCPPQSPLTNRRHCATILVSEGVPMRDK